jgi:hypothetical protein
VRAPILVLLALLTGCDKGKTTEPGSAELAVVPPTYGKNANIGEKAQHKCKFDRELGRAVAESVPGAAVTSGGGAKVLTLEITRVTGADPTWEGEMSVIVEGTLEKDGGEIGKFRLKRRAVGGITGGMKAVCTGLDDIAEQMAEDIAHWVTDPGPDDELGG